MKKTFYYLFTLAILSLFIGWSYQPASAAADVISTPLTTITVNSIQDGHDNNATDGVCNTGNVVTVNGVSSPECTLRAAVTTANNVAGTTPVTIGFNILNTNGTCPSTTTAQVITAVTANYNTTPTYNYRGSNYYGSYIITRSYVTIDGYTQCGSAPNSGAVTGNAKIRIEVRGPGTTASYVGIIFKGADYGVVKGLSIYRWGRGLEYHFSNNGHAHGNFFGMKADGTSGSGNTGLRLYYATNTLLGGTTPAERNVTAGLSNDGYLFEDGANYNHVWNSYFGVKQDGVTKLTISRDLLDIQTGAGYNWVGGIITDVNGNPVLDANGRTQADPNKRNIISGGNDDAIELTHTPDTRDNHIVGNWIGLAANGTTPMGNGADGVNIEDNNQYNYVYQNIIVNNASDGVTLWSTSNNEIYDNWIGYNPLHPDPLLRPMPNGTGVSPHGKNGIHILGASENNKIYRNVIAHNVEYGIYLRPEATYTNSYTNCSNRYNSINQNSMFENGHFNGIRLHTRTCFDNANVTGTQNEALAAPTLNAATSNTAVAYATTCAGCLVEVFANQTGDTNAGGGIEGRIYSGSAYANGSGQATVILQGTIPSGYLLTATATNANGSTSQFSSSITVNAPSCPTPPAAPTASISLSGSNVQLSWNPIASIKSFNIYASSEPYFTPAAGNLVANTTNNSYTFNNVASNTYYVIRTVDYCNGESTNSLRLGYFAMTLKPQWNMVAWPLVPSNVDINTIVGTQLPGTSNALTSSQINWWNNATQSYQTSWYCGGDCATVWGAGVANKWLNTNMTVSTQTLPANYGFWVINRSGANQTLRVVGEVATTARTATITSGNWQMLGSTFPVAKGLNNLGFTPYGSTSSATADVVQTWNADTQSYTAAWYCGGAKCESWGAPWANQWLDDNYAVSTLTITPGAGFWYQNRSGSGYTWTNPAP